MPTEQAWSTRRTSRELNRGFHRFGTRIGEVHPPSWTASRPDEFMRGVAGERLQFPTDPARWTGVDALPERVYDDWMPPSNCDGPVASHAIQDPAARAIPDVLTCRTLALDPDSSGLEQLDECRVAVARMVGQRDITGGA
jgi:hypothetical protein